ncbi:unnamed protein product, partial [Symbiodinium necroappetens]
EADYPEGTKAPQNHVIEEVGGVLKTWRSDRPSRQAALWLSRDGIVMLGKGNVQLDMTTVGSRSIRWKGRHGDVWEWRWMGDTVHHCACVSWLTREEAWHLHHLGIEVVMVQNVCRTVENANRAANIVTVAAELATFEDRVHDGNLFLVGDAERFWKRADLEVPGTNLLLLSHPAKQEKVVNEGWNRWNQEKLTQQKVLKFMNRVNVEGLAHSEFSLWPRPFRPTQRASPEQIEEAVQKALKRIGQAEELSWHKLRAIFAGRGFWTRRQQEETGGSLETATDLNPPENRFLKLRGLADAPS